MGDSVPDQAADQASGTGTRPRRLRAWLGRPRRLPQPPGGLVYDAFISYSHAADGQLAPAVQRGLQRFAKPWYRTRALHIFRDDDSLSANPDLWASVERALDASGHLILLASPEAAESRWVAREVAHWNETKPAGRILIGLTGGELSWDGSGPAVGSALPVPLRQVFTDEPRLTDLRWARTADHLSLRNPRFAQAIADLAAPLHGVPKEELAGEEVRQHRRTVRIVQGAVTLLAMLTATAIVAGLVAYSQYRSALGRALAATATADLGSNPEQSLDDALQSTQTADSGAGVQALRLALATAPLRMSISSGAGRAALAAWDPVADRIAVTGPDGSAQLWDPRTGRIERRLPGPLASRAPLAQLAYSPDGAWLAGVTAAGGVAVWNTVTGRAVPTARLNQEIRRDNSVAGAISGPGGISLLGTTIVWSVFQPDGLVVYGDGIRDAFLFGASSGALRRLGKPSWADGTAAVAPSPDGSRLFVAWEHADGLLGSAAAILTLRTGRWRTLTSGINWTGHQACWTGDGRTLVAWDPTEAQDLTVRTWNTQTGRATASYPAAGGTITAVACGRGPARSWFASGDLSGHVDLHALGGTTFDLVGQGQMIMAAASSPGGSYLATASQDGTGRVWDAQTGRQLQLLSDGDPIGDIQFSQDGGLVLTVDARGVVRVWDAGVGEPAVRLARPAAGQSYALGFRAGGRLVYGLDIELGPGGSAAKIDWAAVLLWKASTGRLVRRIPLPPDIGAAAVPCTKQLDVIEFCGERLPPPASLVTALPVRWRVSSPYGQVTHDGVVTERLVGMAVSPDASEVAYSDAAGVTVLGRSGRVLGRLALPQRPSGLSFAHHSAQLVVMTSSAVYLWRPGAGQPAVRLREASPPLDAEFSGDDTRLVTADEGGDVTVWGVPTGTRVATFHPSRAFERRVTGAYGPRAPIPPVPVRVAINADGTEIAAGTAWWTVSWWNVAQRRLLAVRLAAPGDQPIGGFGAGGPFQITELGFSGNGSRLVAVDYPVFTATDLAPPVTATIFSAAGRLLHTWSSPAGALALDPGAAFDPSGEDLLAGPLGLAPAPPGGSNAVYELADGQSLTSLPNAVIPAASLGGPPLPAQDYAFAWPALAQPWAPDGTEVLAGADAIYRCAACGTLPQLQQAAQLRLRWARPLSAGHDVPPSGSPF